MLIVCLFVFYLNWYYTIKCLLSISDIPSLNLLHFYVYIDINSELNIILPMLF